MAQTTSRDPERLDSERFDPGRSDSGRRNRSLGARGEALAADHLEALGCEVLARNWRAGRQGELDLVVQDGGSIVAVEVKTRSGRGYGSPFEAITARKAARLRRLLHEWVRQHPTRASGLRIDAVAVILLPGEPPRIEHLRGIS